MYSPPLCQQSSLRSDCKPFYLQVNLTRVPSSVQREHQPEIPEEPRLAGPSLQDRNAVVGKRP